MRAQIEGAYRSEHDWREASKHRQDSFVPDDPKRTKAGGTSLQPLTGNINRDLAAPSRGLDERPQSVQMPNDAYLVVRTSKEAAEKVAQAYWRIVEDETRRARWSLVGRAALWWW